MKRSQFMTLGLAGLSGVIFAPKQVIAQTRDPKAGGLYYTAESPGRWSEKVTSHVPHISVLRSSGGAVNIQVETSHSQDGYAHYIIKHQLLDSDFNYITEALFDPTTGNVPKSEFTLDNYRGTLYALSYCNLHDVWLDSVEV